MLERRWHLKCLWLVCVCVCVCVYVCVCVQVMGSLVRVSMPQNGINAEGICALAHSFSHNPNLEVMLVKYKLNYFSFMI